MNSETRVPHTFTDEQIALASSNYESQEWLIRELNTAFIMSGRTIEELAADLGMATDEAQAWLDGEMDLTLSELRQLANSVDAHVTYRVGPLRTRYVEKFVEMHSGEQWQDIDWAAPSVVRA